MATGEETDDESLGGAEMHARVSGLADYFAVDERDALRPARRVVARLNWRKAGPAIRGPRRRRRSTTRTSCSDRPRRPARPPSTRARCSPGSSTARDFDEFKPLYGPSLVTGWAQLHGYPVGILANAQGVLFSAESQKAAQFIQLANQRDIPLLFLQNTTGYMVGKEYEQGGIIKHGAMMINAVSNSPVPHLTVLMGASLRRRQLRHVRPGLRPAVPVRLAQRQVGGDGPAAAGRGAVDRGPAGGGGAGASRTTRRPTRRCAPMVEQQIEAESLPMFLSGRLYDDGVIDPRDTRTVLGLCLSAVHTRARSRARAAASASSGCEAARSDHVDCWSPTGARSPAGSSAPAATLGIAHRRGVLRRRRRTPRTSREADARGTAAGRGARRHLPARRPARRRPRWPRARTPSTPATASCPRTPTSRAAVLDAGLTWVGPPPEAIEAMGVQDAAPRS